MTRPNFPRTLSNVLAAACLLGLAACAPADNDAATSASDASTQAKPASTQAPASTTPAPSKPAAATNDSVADSGDNLSKWNGYGDMVFGMDEAAFRNAWQGDLNDYEFEDKTSCFHLWPKGQKSSAALAFMFGDGKFTRYSTDNPKLTAPGGGKIGMTRSDIDKLYPGRVDAQPHKYTNGQYLRITQGKDVLIFETDEAGKVTEWRVGVPPDVDYVEGCA